MDSESKNLIFPNNESSKADDTEQNADTCQIFVEKTRIEAILQLFTLPLMSVPALLVKAYLLLSRIPLLAKPEILNLILLKGWPGFIAYSKA
ncbi:hypothetical protein VNO77_04056 [Canavalia gladiata]|uniref:Uncharacterized protein n=1 Tax=Canavalia gladiata TaxID=3824 RepID=A0AAN9MVV1_CANGL